MKLLSKALFSKLMGKSLFHPLISFDIKVNGFLLFFFDCLELPDAGS